MTTDTLQGREPQDESPDVVDALRRAIRLHKLFDDPEHPDAITARRAIEEIAHLRAERDEARESVQQAMDLAARLAAQRNEARARCSRLEEALRSMANDGCWTGTNCGGCYPCAASRALTDSDPSEAP